MCISYILSLWVTKKIQTLIDYLNFGLDKIHILYFNLEILEFSNGMKTVPFKIWIQVFYGRLSV